MSMNDRYWLPRGGEETQRLNYQHELLTRTAGYVIHPTILKSLPPDPKIADVGSGTAVWLLDVAHSNHFTNGEFYGFDMSNEQFPALRNGNVPMSFITHNIKDPFPEEFREQFDLIHLRFIATGLQTADYSIVVNNVVDLLKAGGAIQWQEARFDQMKVYQPAADASTSVFRDTLYALMQNIGLKRLGYPPKHLAALLEKAGLVNVEEHITSSDRFPQDRKPYSKHLVATWKSGNQPQTRITPFGPSEEQIEKLEDQMHAEIEGGAYVRFDNHTFVGFKPYS